MTLVPYCSAADVETLWSVFGVAVRIDDEADEDSAALLASMIGKATADVNFYLLQVYSPAALASATWVRWCTAYFAAVDIARRRGNAAPESMLAEYDRYKELLKAVLAGEALIPGDDGLLAPEHDVLPCATNLRVDSRFRTIIRYTPQNSTSGQREASRKSFSLPQGVPYWW
jgi:hypothetical protein